MFTRKQRVNRKLFIEGFKNGKKFSSPLFNVALRNSSSDLQTAKFSVVVSKKNFKTAVLRNFQKRRTYHAIREAINAEKRDLPPGIYIFFLKKDAMKVSFENLKAEIGKIFNH